MLCCCGLFSISILDDDKIKIQYRPYKYRKKILEEMENGKNDASNVIQRKYRELRDSRSQKKLNNTLVEMSNSVSKVGIMMEHINDHHLELKEEVVSPFDHV